MTHFLHVCIRSELREEYKNINVKKYFLTYNVLLTSLSKECIMNKQYYYSPIAVDMGDKKHRRVYASVHR